MRTTRLASYLRLFAARRPDARAAHRVARWMLLIGVFALTAGCGDRATLHGDAALQPDGGGSDAPVGSDATLTGPWRFVADDDGSAPTAVTLRVDDIRDDHVSASVMVRGADEVQGVAFRLAFEGGTPKLVRGEASTALNAPVAARFVLRERERELWGGVGHVGPRAVAANQPVVVARIELELSGSGPIETAFLPGRGLVLRPDGNAIEAAWLGGRFERTAP